jgi:hypothetical protein
MNLYVPPLDVAVSPLSGVKRNPAPEHVEGTYHAVF